ncbi:DNA-3-methyladenine glycosylase family protein [Parenemella sanctibonifatiensis]|uniref:DNA-3-methyladenine glycosylase family protein n=1 Tax=Parenemella sanctibonifatiensis TaxID=2016505 RepID=UPI001E4884CA|nr:DNA-3-methyladenine glycosylase 2 family protein [Parenemella sanctibonifatiensis]
MTGQAEGGRVWISDRPIELASLWSTWRRGSGDPTYRITAGRHWRGLLTPAGPATLAVSVRANLREVRAQAWGAGSDWVLDQLPAMLGDADDTAGDFQPEHPVLQQAWQRHRHWRVTRGGMVWPALYAAILEQKVTGQEAFGGQGRLVRAYGSPAPGAATEVKELGLMVPPGPETVRQIPSWEWIRMPVGPERSAAVVRAAAVADRLEESLAMSSQDADRRLQAVPGVGPWTSAEVRQRAHGDPDAISLGDYHVGKNIGWALAGEREADDARAAELLQPYLGHRYRVQRLLELAGATRPRRGPRMAPRRHLPR